MQVPPFTLAYEFLAPSKTQPVLQPGAKLAEDKKKGVWQPSLTSKTSFPFEKLYFSYCKGHFQNSKIFIPDTVKHTFKIQRLYFSNCKDTFKIKRLYFSYCKGHFQKLKNVSKL